jgi:hypothetical protein
MYATHNRLYAVPLPFLVQKHRPQEQMSYVEYQQVYQLKLTSKRNFLDTV